MSRVGTILNLETDGTYDLLIMGFPNGFPRGYISFEIGDTPRRITGVQKVVQSFLITLMTSKGSDPIAPNRGTAFNAYTNNANVGANPDELNAAILQCVSDAEAQTKQILNSDNNDLASQLESVQFLFARALNETTTFGLQILTRAGELTSIAIPAPQTDLLINERGYVNP